MTFFLAHLLSFDLKRCSFAVEQEPFDKPWQSRYHGSWTWRENNPLASYNFASSKMDFLFVCILVCFCFAH